MNMNLPENNPSIGLLGAGAVAREISDYAKELSTNVEFVAVDPDYLSERGLVRMIDILKPNKIDSMMPVLTAAGAPGLKKALVTKWLGSNYTKLVARDAWVSASAEISDDCVVAPMAAVGLDVKLGQHSFVNLGATLSHDVETGEYCTISPGVHIGGRVKLGDGVFVGIGANIKNDIKIADGVIIGAGSVVIKDIVDKNAVVVGNPGRVIKINEDWLDEI